MIHTNLKLSILFLAATFITFKAVGQSNSFPSSGNVTIGSGNLIQTGGYNLETQGAVKVKNYLLFDGDGDFTGGNYFTIQDHISGNYLRMGSGFSDHFTINSNGNVGVGTSNTGNGILTINSNTSTNLLRLENDGPGNESTLRFRAKSISGRTLHADISLFDPEEDIGFLGFKVPHNNNVSLGYHLIINEQGRVGIGTITPDSKLTVNGTIHSQEVKVTVNAGADYVFEEDYELSSLKELAQFIKQFKHLPEVPPASAMEKDGIELSKMNILLLKKVEELTLYVIEMESRIKELEKKK